MMLPSVHRGSPPFVTWADCDGWVLADAREPRRMRPHLRPAGPAGCCPQRELHPPAGSVPVLASSPADLAAWRRRPTRNPSPSSSGRRSARPGEPSSRSHDVTGGGARPTRTQRLPSMNFRQRGQMRQRLRAICRFGWHGPSASQGEPHWNAGRTADRSRVASPSLTHALAGAAQPGCGMAVY